MSQAPPLTLQNDPGTPLRLFLFFANQGAIKKSQIEEQINQASCLTLLTNAVMIWNTRYMEAVIDQLEWEGHMIDCKDLIRLSPARYEHINKYGKYNFNIEKDLKKGGLRPLRKFKIS